MTRSNILSQTSSNRIGTMNAMKRRSGSTSRRRICSSSSTKGTTALLSSILATLLATTQLTPAQAGLSGGPGGVSSTSTCYSALQAATLPNTQVIDKEGYVTLINTLSSNAFTAFQYNADFDEWNYFPVSNFDQLPQTIRNEFYKHACGGPFVFCDEAYLYAEGSASGGVLGAQQEIYLYQVCVGVEEAIDVSKPAPTPAPVEPAVPDCPPLYNENTFAGTGGDYVSVKNGFGVDAMYTYFQCKPFPASGWCGQAAYAPMNSANWPQAWDLVGECDGSNVVDVVEPPSPPTPPPTWPTYPPTTMEPTPAPVGPGIKFSGVVPLKLTYHAAVSQDVTSEDLQSNPSSQVRGDLLQAMDAWSFAATTAYMNLDSSTSATGKRHLSRGNHVSLRGGVHGKRGRVLEVKPGYSMTEKGVTDMTIMNVTDVGCSKEISAPLQQSDHCIEVVSSLVIQFIDEPLGSKKKAIEFLEESFESDILDGSFYNSHVPASAKTDIREMYNVPTNEDLSLPNDDKKTQTPDIDQMLESLPSDPSEDGGSNVGGIVGGIIFALVIVGATGFFVYKRRRDAYDSDYSSSGSGSGSYKKKQFDPANDLEGGRANSGSDSGSSRDEFSSSDSQSSGSMQSYSGSEGSKRSRGSSSSGSSSRSRSTRSSTDSRSRSRSGSGSAYSSSYTSQSEQNGGPQSLSASETDDSRSSDANSPAVIRSTGSERSVGRGISSLDSSAKDDRVYLRNNSTGSSIGGASDPGHTSEEQSSQSSSARDASSASYTSASYTSSRDASSATSGGGYRVDANLVEQQEQTSQEPSSRDDESSAGSSGWDSSDGDSSVDSDEVQSYDPNTLGNMSAPSTSYQSSTTGDDSTLQDERGYAVNPAVNPVVQPGVTMMPIGEVGSSEEDSTAVTPISEVSSQSIGRRRDRSPPQSAIQEAIEAGDWAAVGATAAILASDSDSVASSRASREMDGELGASDSLMSNDDVTADEDEERAMEIDQLVEDGNWDGVVAVAARYADEADEADESLGKPRSSHRDSVQSDNSRTVSKTSSSLNRSHSTTGSVSVETADASSVASNTTRDSQSHTTGTYSTGMDDTTMGDGASTVSGSGLDSGTPPDSATHGSSITSSYVTSNSEIRSSMISAMSSVDPREKREMNAYRAEVEALVRRVVPDEIDNVDDIMVQFSGREEELIETLRAMQEKSIAQRARAAVQKSAKKEAGRTGRSMDDSSEDLGQSVATDDDSRSYTTDGNTTESSFSKSSYSKSSYSQSASSQSYSKGDSRTDNFTHNEEDELSASSRSSRGDSMSSSSSSSFSSRSGSDGGGTAGSIGIISVGRGSNGEDIVKTSPGLGAALDASDWRAVGEVARRLGGDGVGSARSLATSQSGQTSISRDTRDELDQMIDQGNWSGIIDAASNMAGGQAGVGSDEDLD